MDIRETAKAVAEELGEGWKLADTGHYSHGSTIDRESDGARLFLRGGGHRIAGRIAVSGVYPYGPNAYTDPSFKVEITVADTKTPRQIALDIARRVLPSYLENLAKVQEQNDKEAEAQKNREAVAANLTHALGKTYEGGDRISLSHLSGAIYGNAEVSYSGSTVHLDVHGIPAHKAIAIMKMLAGE